MIKLNIGSHSKRVEGYVNVDALDLPNVDIIHNVTKFPWPFAEDNTVDEILMQEFLEHVEFRMAVPILRECWRILKPGGVLHVQVPDIEAMCRMIDAQCVCVPRKAAKYEDYKPDPNCFNCGGKALIHPERWHVAFTGAQKHEYDLHRNQFTEDYLGACLEAGRFKQYVREPNIYKLIIKATK